MGKRGHCYASCILILQYTEGLRFNTQHVCAESKSRGLAVVGHFKVVIPSQIPCLNLNPSIHLMINKTLITFYSSNIT